MKAKILTCVLTILMFISVVACGKGAPKEAENQENTSVSSAQKSQVNYAMITDKIDLTDEEKFNIMNSYAFAKTTGYISNEELRDYMGDDLIASFANLASNYVSIIYDVDAIRVENEKDSYLGVMDQIVSDNCRVREQGNAFSEEWTKAVIDSGVSMTANFTTCKEMVYADDSEIYVRGILNLKIESARDLSKIRELLPVDVEVGQEYNFVYDIGFIAEENTESEDVLPENGKIDYILALASI